jgi:endonuclease VIII
VPEGDTIFRAAQTLHRALAGEVVTRFESVYPALTRIHHDRPLTGRTIESVSSRGKHLLVAFSGDLTLHTHMRMHGSWHIYRPGERWRASADDMRVLIATAPYVAVGFNIPVAELLTAREISEHPSLSTLGPDLADPAFDRDEALRRLRALSDETVDDALLNQRALAGIGNVFKSEVMFVARVNPFATVAALGDDQLARLIDVALKQMAMSIGTREQTLSASTGRRTTGSLNPMAKLYVYGRAGKPCRRCGTSILSNMTGSDARRTFWCPRCQKP